MLARICFECKEYVKVGFAYRSNRKIHAFDLDHEKHALATMEITDPKDLKHLDNVDEFYEKLTGYLIAN